MTCDTCGLFYKHITIVNDDSGIVNMFETSLTGDAKVIIYDCYMFVVQATCVNVTNFFLFFTGATDKISPYLPRVQTCPFRVGSDLTRKDYF